jgi:hypothetical protein
VDFSPSVLCHATTMLYHTNVMDNGIPMDHGDCCMCGTNSTCTYACRVCDMSFGVRRVSALDMTRLIKSSYRLVGRLSWGVKMLKMVTITLDLNRSLWYLI